MKIDRNGPCPCGSGQKFKKCHLGREHELRGEAAIDGGAAEKKALDKNILYAVAAVIVLGAIAVAFMGYADWAVAGGGGGLILLGGYIVLRDPPPPNKDKGDPSGINFGN